MKNICLSFCFLISFVGFSQNHWEQYNNQPVKKVTYYNTNQSLDTTNTPKTEVYYYPNGLISKSEYGNPNFKQTRFYLYQADSLAQVVTQITEQREVQNYDLEEVLENHEKVYLKSAKVYSQYNFFTGETLGEVGIQNNGYDKNNFMMFSLKEKEPNGNRSYFELSENRYKKQNITSSFFKVFSVDQTTNDTVVDYQNQSNYNILDENKIGSTALEIISGRDTIYQKIVYELYTKNELKNEKIHFTTLEDILVFDIDKLVYEEISKEGFYLLLNHFNKLNLKEENTLGELEKWEQIFAQYIDQLLGDLKLDLALEACEMLLKNPEHLQFESLFALNSVGYGIAYDKANWGKAKSFANQLILLQLEQNNIYGAKMLQARLGELEVRLNNKTKAQEILKELLEYKKELKKNTTDLSGYIEISYDELEYHVNFNKFAYQIANLFNLLENKEQAKQILQDNLSDFARLEEAGYPADFYYKVRDKNNALLDELN